MIVYWSGSGITSSIAERYGGVPLKEYVKGQPFTLVFPTYGSPRTGGYVPSAVQEFLGFHGHCMDAVIGVGNTTFGYDFCKGAWMVSGAYGVPVLACIDVVPSKDQAEILEETRMKYEEVSRAERSAKPSGH